jgi:hypothetical protein
MQFVDGLSEQQLRIYNDLKHLILELNPALYEKTVYGVPFFYRSKRVFYLAQEAKSKRLYLGFCRGVELDPENHFLEGKGNTIRKIFLDDHGVLEDENFLP